MFIVLGIALTLGILWSAWEAKEWAGSFTQALKDKIENAKNVLLAFLNPLNWFKLMVELGKFFGRMLAGASYASSKADFGIAWNRIIAGGIVGGFDIADGTFSAQHP